MRHLRLLLLLLPFSAAAQDCALRKTIDPYTKETRLSTGLIELQNGSLAIEADKAEIDFFFSMSGGEKCFSDQSTAVINYEGTKLKATFKNLGPNNCEGFFHIIFRNAKGTNALLQRLVTQKITTIQFTGNNKSPILFEFTPADQENVMKRGQCLVEEAKKLLE